MADGLAISPATQAAVEEGLRRFERGLFWEAHEAWEEAWLVEQGTVKLGLQALIQMTAAFHKGHRMHNQRAMLTLLASSIEKLHHVVASGSCFAGIDAGALLRDLHDISDRAALSIGLGDDPPGAPRISRCF